MIKLSSYFFLYYTLLVFWGCSSSISDQENCQFQFGVGTFPRPEGVKGDLKSGGEFCSFWNKLVRSDTSLVDYLMTFEGDTKQYVTCNSGVYRIGFSDVRVSFWTTSSISEITNEIAALHLICGLYHNNYYFSSNRELYSVSDSAQIYRTLDLPTKINLFNSNQDVELAWKSIKEWRESIVGQTVQEANNLGNSPFYGTGLVWLGEKGCIINKDYNPVEICGRHIPK